MLVPEIKDNTIQQLALHYDTSAKGIEPNMNEVITPTNSAQYKERKLFHME